MSTVETMSGDVPGGEREGDWECSGCHNRNYAFRSFCNRCKQPRVPGEGREGDWECIGCRNRNYAFRSFCNRCKQSRLLVDNNTPANSKWLPRVGDWICTGCTNNNYASREMCKKCGQPKEVAAMPAFAMPGVSLQTYPRYFPRAQGGYEQKLNLGFLGNGAPQQSLPLSSNWPLGGADRYGVQSADRYGVQPTSTWSFGGNQSNGVPYANQVSQSLAPTEWHGDWICTCGFQNYSSCAECKKCDAAKPAVYPALGTKRLASEELVPYWDNKRLNAGQTLDLQHTTLGQLTSSVVSQTAAPYPSYPAGSSTGVPNLQVNLKLPQLVTMPPLPGKGARQWRDGDWMCTNCKNHNYAMRSHCNKCKTQREELTQQVSVS